MSNLPGELLRELLVAAASQQLIVVHITKNQTHDLNENIVDGRKLARSTCNRKDHSLVLKRSDVLKNIKILNTTQNSSFWTIVH